MNAEDLERLRSQRLAFLRVVYRDARGRTNAGFLSTTIAAELGFDEELSDTIAQYLVDEGLLRWFSMGHLAITHGGIVEIESGITSPERPTEHFPAVVIAESYLQVGSMIGSAVQQGTTGSTQTVGAPLDVDALRGVLLNLRSAIAELPLDADEQAEASAQLATIDAQLSSSKPERMILRHSAAMIGQIVQTAVASGAAPEVQALTEKLVHLVGATM